MAILDIITEPDKKLRVKSESVEYVDDNIRKIFDDMHETMQNADGVGLAAIQVGIAKRLIVIDFGDKPYYIANPVIIKHSIEKSIEKEACLSLPNQCVFVSRYKSITLEFLDYHNKTTQIDADGWFARAIMHELDHLNGKLLIDYLKFAEKQRVIAALKNLKKFK